MFLSGLTFVDLILIVFGVIGWVSLLDFPPLVNLRAKLDAVKSSYGDETSFGATVVSLLHKALECKFCWTFWSTLICILCYATGVFLLQLLVAVPAIVSFVSWFFGVYDEAEENN